MRLHPLVRTTPTLLRLMLVIGLVAAMAALALPTIDARADLLQVNGEAPGRLAGPDRFATAAAIAVETFPDGADTVLLARGDQYADALSASALAGATDAPLLLVGGTEPPSATMQALQELGTEQVVLVGGSAAIPDQVADLLRDAGVSVSRVEGDDRYETAAAVAGRVADAQALGVIDGRTTAFVASGESYPDALVAGGAAFAGPHPILLSTSQQLGTATVEAIGDLDIEQVVLLGGTAALSGSIEAQLDDLGVVHRRLGGATRLETAALVADFAVEQMGFATDQVILARGDDFPDALAAGPYAGTTGSPVLLTAGTNQIGSPSAMWLRGWCDVIGRVTAIGSFGVLSDLVLAAAVAALNCDAPLPGEEPGGEGQAGRELLNDVQRHFTSSVEGWVPQGNTTISQVDDIGRSDDTSMAVLVDEDGPFDDDSRTARVGTSTARDGVPVAPGRTYEASWWIRPEGPISPVRCELRWYDDGGNIIDTIGGELVQQHPNTWIQTRCGAVAPDEAAYAGLRVFIAEADYGDRHFVDDASLSDASAPSSPDIEPTPTPSATEPDPPPSEPVPTSPDGYPNGPGDTGIAAAGLQRADLRPSGTISVGSGEVVDGLLVRGSIILEDGASDVVIRNTLIEGTGRYGIESNSGVRGLLVENVTIEGQSGERSSGILAIGQGTIRRADVSGYADGIKVFSSFVVEQTWIHDLVNLGGSHNDGIQGVGGSGLVIRNNRIVGPHQAQTSAVLIQAANGPIRDVTIEGNLLSGGNYTLYVTNKDDQPAPTDITIANNVWDGVSDVPSQREPSNSWQFGTCSLDRGSGWTITGNTFRDGGSDPC